MVNKKRKKIILSKIMAKYINNNVVCKMVLTKTFLLMLCMVLIVNTVSAYNISVEAQLTDPDTGDVLTGDQTVNFTMYNSTNATIFTDSSSVSLDSNGRFHKYYDINYSFNDYVYTTWKVGSDSETDKNQVGYAPYCVSSETLVSHNDYTLNNLNATGNISASFYKGDGSLLSGISSSINGTSINVSSLVIGGSSGGAVKLSNDAFNVQLDVFARITEFMADSGDNDVQLRFSKYDGTEYGSIQADFGGDHLFFGTDSSQLDFSFIFGNYLFAHKNYDHGGQSSPTIYIHSDTDPDTDNTQWISLTHNESNPVIDSGKGNITFDEDILINEVLYFNDGTSLSTAPTGDSLGNHTATQSLQMNNFNVTINGSTFSRIPNVNEDIDGHALGLYMTNPPGNKVPHMIIQSGGADQASIIARSVAIVDENETILTSPNATDCQAWADHFGITRRVDCNTTTTGADLFVGDDGQFGGDVTLSEMDGGGTYYSLNHYFNLFSSAGRIAGGVVTANASGDGVNVTAGQGFFRIADDDTSSLKFADWSASNNLAIPADSTRIVGVKYNSGSPVVYLENSEDDFDLDTEFQLAIVVRDDTGTHILNTPWQTGDTITNLIERTRALGEFQRDEHFGGLVLSVPTGTRNISVTAGKVWNIVNEFDITALDTSVSGTFEVYWRNSTGDWKDSDQNEYNITHYNDITADSLQTLGNNQYMNWWVYVEAQDDDISLVYGQEQYASSAGAEAESPPSSIPEHIDEQGLLIGRIIIREGTEAAVQVDTVWETTFTASQAADHGNLAGLTDDDHDGLYYSETEVDNFVNSIENFTMQQINDSIGNHSQWLSIYPNVDTDSTDDLDTTKLDNDTIIRNHNTSWITSNQLTSSDFHNQTVNTTSHVNFDTVNISNRSCYETDVCITEGTDTWIYLMNHNETKRQNLGLYNLHAQNLIELAGAAKLIFGYTDVDKYMRYNTGDDVIEMILDNINFVQQNGSFIVDKGDVKARTFNGSWNESSKYATLDSPTFTTEVNVPDAFNIGNKITHTGDTNTELQVTSDQWNVVTGASSRFTINNNGVAVSNGNLDLNSNDIIEVGEINATDVVVNNNLTFSLGNLGIWSNGSGICIGTCT